MTGSGHIKPRTTLTPRYFLSPVIVDRVTGLTLPYRDFPFPTPLLTPPEVGRLTGDRSLKMEDPDKGTDTFSLTGSRHYKGFGA